MMGRTHFLIGAWAGLGLAQHLQADHAQALVIVTAACFGAALPDIDHPRAGLRQRLGVIGDGLLGWLKHRGPTHSLLALAAVILIGLHTNIVYGAAVAVGYASHILADMSTHSGVYLLWPGYRQPVWVLPRKLRVSTAGRVEMVVEAISAGLVFWYALDRAGLLSRILPAFQ